MKHLLLAATIIGLLPGCLLATNSNTTHQGRYISETTLAKVQPGATKAEVAAHLGSPSEQSSSPEGREVWKWEYEATTTRRCTFLLIVTSARKTRSTHAVHAEFEGDRLVRTWRD